MLKLSPRLLLQAKFTIDQRQTRPPGGGSEDICTKCRTTGANSWRRPCSRRRVNICTPKIPSASWPRSRRPIVRGLLGELLAFLKAPHKDSPHGPAGCVYIDVERLPQLFHQLCEDCEFCLLPGCHPVLSGQRGASYRHAGPSRGCPSPGTDRSILPHWRAVPPYAPAASGRRKQRFSVAANVAGSPMRRAISTACFSTTVASSNAPVKTSALARLPSTLALSVLSSSPRASRALGRRAAASGETQDAGRLFEA